MTGPDDCCPDDHGGFGGSTPVETPSGRARQPAATVPVLVKLIDLDEAVEKAMRKFRDQFFRDFVTNVDRQALERAIAAAETAKDEALAAKAADVASRAVSLRRFHRLIAAHAVTGALVLVLAGALLMMVAFALENRARLERAADGAQVGR